MWHASASGGASPRARWGLGWGGIGGLAGRVRCAVVAGGPADEWVGLGALVLGPGALAPGRGSGAGQWSGACSAAVLVRLVRLSCGACGAFGEMTDCTLKTWWVGWRGALE